MALSDNQASRIFSGLSGPVQGALLMTVASIGFAVMNVLIRYAGQVVPPEEIVFFRNFFALLVLLPWALKHGRTQLRTKRPVTHFLRALVGLAAMFTWFTAVTLMPMAEAVALNFTMPLFATLCAALILRESVGIRRWSATAVGFLGALVIVRPGFATVEWVTLLPILSAIIMSFAAMFVKSLSRTDHTAAIVFLNNLIITPLSLLMAVWVWVWPDPQTLLLLFGVGCCGAFSHLCLTQAFHVADASAVIPFDYTRLPLVALLGYLFFAEVPDLWTWVGAAIIAGSAIYIVEREAYHARRRGEAGRVPLSAERRADR